MKFTGLKGRYETQVEKRHPPSISRRSVGAPVCRTMLRHHAPARHRAKRGARLPVEFSVIC